MTGLSIQRDKMANNRELPPPPGLPTLRFGNASLGEVAQSPQRSGGGEAGGAGSHLTFPTLRLWQHWDIECRHTQLPLVCCACVTSSRTDAYHQIGLIARGWDRVEDTRQVHHAWHQVDIAAEIGVVSARRAA